MQTRKYHTAIVKRYTTKLAQKLMLPLPQRKTWLQLLPFLFFIAVFITNTIAWLNGGTWYNSVLNTWLLAAWLVGTGLIYRSGWK